MTKLGALACVVATVAVLAARAEGSQKQSPLWTAVVDASLSSTSDPELAYERVRTTGSTYVRLYLRWNDVAPTQALAPAVARDPGASEYRWSSFERELVRARDAGLEPLVTVFGAPKWAEARQVPKATGSGPFRPRPEELADFMTAAATRYGGNYQGLPRVRYWEAWNEPNLSTYLTPQYEGGKAVSPAWYRAMLNAFSDSVHSAAKGARVIAGGLSPFEVQNRSYISISPLEFMRRLLCVSSDTPPRRTCSQVARFDIWSHHPYTSGGPEHEAASEDDVSLGDLAEMKNLLDTAARLGTVSSPRRPQFWVTEFSWDSRPPDPKGVPLLLHARWVSEALYRMWQVGVSLVTWHLLRDQPFRQRTYGQSGLYAIDETDPKNIRRDREKISLQAFRFPFVAFSRAPTARTDLWGRTPWGKPGRIRIERKTQSGWIFVTNLITNRYGIFAGIIRTPTTRGMLRARLDNSSDTSVPFSLTTVPDRPVCSFGTC